MPPKRITQYNLIKSDDSDVSFDEDQLNPIQQQLPYSNKGIKQDLFYKFISNDYFHITKTLKVIMEQIFKFLQQRKSILFIFGPSGCGKTSLIKKFLSIYKISYSIIKQHQISDQTAYEGQLMVSLQQSILQAMRQQNSTQIKICYDFPIFLQNCKSNEVREFRNIFKTQIMRTNQKIIFILNQQLYSSYSILNQSQNNQLNLLKCQRVQVIKISKYGKNQMKKVLKAWIKQAQLYDFSEYIYDKNMIQEILQLSNGDMRKAMQIVYWKDLQKKNKNLNKNKIKQIQKITTSKNIIKTSHKYTKIQYQNQSYQNISKYQDKLKNYQKIHKQKYYQKVSLYHGLGKLLYGKRLNKINPDKKGKNQISRYYTQKQIDQLDPPFYFDPSALYQNLKIPLQIFTRLLQQNYIQRFGKIKDIKKMSEVFRIYDYLFTSRNNYEDQQVNSIKVILITWGMLIYNKNSRVENRGLQKIQRSQYTNIEKTIKQKKKLIREYFPNNNLSDSLKYAHLTHSFLGNQMINKIIFNSSSFKKTNEVDKNINMINQQDQQYQIQNTQKLSKRTLQRQLTQMVRNQQKKKEQRQQLIKMFQEEDLSDDISIEDDQ